MEFIIKNNFFVENVHYDENLPILKYNFVAEWLYTLHQNSLCMFHNHIFQGKNMSTKIVHQRKAENVICFFCVQNWELIKDKLGFPTRNAKSNLCYRYTAFGSN